MLKNLGAKSVFMMFAAAAAAVSFAPAIQATPVNYDFSVRISSGLLEGTTADGSFSYEDSSIIPGGTNSAIDLLTALDFTFNGISYDATTVNTGSLSFDAAGDLTGFLFGTGCTAGKCGPLTTRADSFLFSSTDFSYIIKSPRKSAGKGTTSYSLVPPAPVPVPEPGTLGLFGLGALMIGLFVGGRRRMC